MNLSGRNIVITGGTSGIGRALVDLLAPRNELWVVGRSERKLELVANEYPTVRAVFCDLSNSESVRGLVQLSGRSLPREIDALILNAAVQHETDFVSRRSPDPRIEEEIATNFASVCRIVYDLLPSLMSEGRDSVISLIGSGLAIAPKSSAPVYCATKAALRSFSQSLGYQLEKTRIHVNHACLPLVDTGMTAGRGQGKISAQRAAELIVRGIESGETETLIGKAKLLSLINRFAPALATRILKNS